MPYAAVQSEGTSESLLSDNGHFIRIQLPLEKLDEPRCKRRAFLAAWETPVSHQRTSQSTWVYH